MGYAEIGRGWVWPAGGSLSTLPWRKGRGLWEGPRPCHLWVCQAPDEDGCVPRSSEEQLGHTYHLLMAQLSQEHAEVRLSAFQVLDQLFARSHHFRMLVVSNFQEFLELTLGTDHERPLPPPREVAQKLRRAATRAVRGWNEKYGTAYKKLALGFHFLTHNKQVGRPQATLPLPAGRPAWPPGVLKGAGLRGSQDRRSSFGGRASAHPRV